MKNRTLALSPVLGIVLSLSPSLVSARPLGFEERIRAQEAIERVYYSRQMGASRIFDEAVPREVLETKVRTYLQKSAALERIWQTPLTAEMLRREVERMVEQTQMPDRLRELFAALGNDPFLIQECLARPVLADRLARNFFAFDQSIHAESRQRAEALRQSLAGPGSVVEEREAFLVRGPLENPGDSSGTASSTIEKEDWDGWWSHCAQSLDALSIEPVAQEGDPAVAAAIASEKIQAGPGCTDDTWEGGLLDEIPDRTPPPIWTGTYMLVWGKSLDEFRNDNKGWRYDPITDTWSQMSRINAPEGRFGHTAIWTGDRMIVWGGRKFGANLNTGGQYDPVADDWSPVSTLNAPSPRYKHLAVWTGSLMIVWGAGPDPLWDGGRYDPSTDTWSPMSTANAPDWSSNYSTYTAVWSAGRMILWNAGASEIRRGGRYDPITDSWASMSIANAPSQRSGSTIISTGSQVIVWGGRELENGQFSVEVNTGGRYDPQTDLWVPTSTTSAPGARYGHSAVWAGSEMMIWGGCSQGACPSSTGGRYNPATDTWTSVSPSNAPPTQGAAALWTGSHVLIWGETQVAGSVTLLGGGRYHLATDSWTPISTGSAPSARSRHSAVWTGTHMVIWGGQGSTFTMTGGRYDPALAAWSTTSTVGAPSARASHSAVWTGQSMIVWGGAAAQATNTGGRYDPLTDSWTPTTVTGAPSPRSGHTVVWTGNLMVVWGGGTNTGGRYDPGTDTWSATSMTFAPSARSLHTAVWTGSVMLIWGGHSGVNVLASGAGYDPVGDSWAPIGGGPGGRLLHGASWTGSHMLIWGGSNGFNVLANGGLYHPGTGSWTSTATASGGGQSGHTTVWTSSQMVVWGGTTASPNLDFSKRYDPASSVWRNTSLADAPADRSLHTAVWTGDRMIVWGGQSTTATLNTGALYCACSGGAVATYYQDADGDGYGIPGVSVPSCSPPAGYAALSGDCNDADAAISPGAAELCNGADDNCNGTVDEGLTVDNDGDGFSVCAGDCDDGNPARHPGAVELCNSIDDDCDGSPEGDSDGDGHSDCTDCRPSDPFTFAAPPEATNLQVVQDQGNDVLMWDDLAPASGVLIAYDLFSGSLAALRQGGGNYASGSCLESGLGFNAFDFSVIDPGPPGGGVYVMVRGRNNCGVGTYGTAHRDQTAAASPLACP